MKRILIILILISSCKPEQKVTDFGITERPISGENQFFSTMENMPVRVSYQAEQQSILSEATIRVAVQPNHGTLSSCEAQEKQLLSCLYTPDENFVGEDFIYFQVVFGDFSSGSDSYIRVQVDPRPEPGPLAPTVGEDQSFNTPVKTPRTFSVSTGSDLTGGAENLTYEIVGPTSNGTLTNCFDGLANTSWTYTPNDNHVGGDEFTYRVKDENGLYSVQTAKVLIQTVQTCNNYKRLSIFLDKNGDELIDEDENLGEISSYLGTETAKENYDYYSYSAHPHVGPAPSDYAGNVFLYEGTDGLALNMIFNKVEGGNTQIWNDVNWEISVKNNNTQDYVMESDDPSHNGVRELRVLEEVDGQWKKYIGDWSYKANTDGGVIGPLVGEDFEVKIKMIDKGDVKDINFHSSKSADDVFLLSDEANTTPTVFFIKFHTLEVCEVYDDQNATVPE